MKSEKNTSARVTRPDAQVSETLRQLRPAQEHVLRLRYGIGNGGHVRSAGDVASSLGMTQRRVRQIETEAIKKLRIVSRGARCTQ